MKTIKQMREKAGMSQQDVANACGISRSMVSSIELGERGASAHVVKRLSDALSVDPMSIVKTMSEDNPLRLKIKRMARTLGVSQIKVFSSMLDDVA